MNKYAFCFVFDDTGKVLVLKRAPHMRTRPNEWDVPGGKVDEGELVVDGVVRELYEEAGIVLTNLELIISKSGEKDGVTHEFSYYRSGYKGVVALSHEHTEYAWHDPLIAATLITYTPHLFGLDKAVQSLKSE
jgi:8-oxo-dGTP diphosphatase